MKLIVLFWGLSGFPGPDRNKSEHDIAFEFHFREKYNRVIGIYGCPDLVVDLVVDLVAGNCTGDSTKNNCSSNNNFGNNYCCSETPPPSPPSPRTTAQTPNPPQTGSAVGPVQVAHEGDWTGLEIFGATWTILFFIYVGLMIGSALCLLASTGLDVWWPGKHKKASQVLTHLGCFFLGHRRQDLGPH